LKNVKVDDEHRCCSKAKRFFFFFAVSNTSKKMPSLLTTIFIQLIITVGIIVIILNNNNYYYFSNNNENPSTTTTTTHGELFFNDPYIKPTTFNAPRLTGLPLFIAGRLIRLPVIGDLVTWNIRRENDFHMVTRFANQIAFSYSTTHAPLHIPTPEIIQQHTQLAALKHAPTTTTTTTHHQNNNIKSSFQYKTSTMYINDYLSGKDSPTRAILRILHQINSRSNSNSLNTKLRSPISSLNMIETLRQATESTKRYEEKRPLSKLDGVPIVIKEELRVAGNFSRSGSAGTKFLPVTQHQNENIESSSVTRLKQAGAIVIGLTVMHELGIGITGNNPSVSSPGNPHSLEHYSGGSSSGTGVAVAANFVPIGVGVDGGGSIRIPAAFNGVFGIKPTYQRVSDDAGFVVGGIGPLASTVSDLALAYMTMVGSSSVISNHPSLHQPPPHLAHVFTPLDSNFRVCIFSDFVRDASEPDIFNTYNSIIQELRQIGVQIIEKKGFPHVNELIRAHAITILSEMASLSDVWWNQHAHELNAESSLSLVLGRSFSNRDVLNAMRIKTWAMELFHGYFNKGDKCDVLLLPATGKVAPKIPPGGLEYGEGNHEQTSQVMMFSSFANFVGLPAGVAPVSYTSDGEGMPISIQAMADAWCEHKVLRVLNFLEQIGKKIGGVPRKPKDVVMEHNS
jgi:Asp-tRNA(Asn)/Glu-tRNA(Gln) amidotransferase A subunit family amidase